MFANAYDLWRQNWRLRRRPSRVNVGVNGESQQAARFARQINDPAVAVGNDKLGVASLEKGRVDNFRGAERVGDERLQARHDAGLSALGRTILALLRGGERCDAPTLFLAEPDAAYLQDPRIETSAVTYHASDESIMIGPRLPISVKSLSAQSPFHGSL